MHLSFWRCRAAEDNGGVGASATAIEQPTPPARKIERRYMIASDLDYTPTPYLAAIVQRAKELGQDDPVIRVHEWVPGSLLASDSRIWWQPLSAVLRGEPPPQPDLDAPCFGAPL